MRGLGAAQGGETVKSNENLFMGSALACGSHKGGESFKTGFTAITSVWKDFC